MSNFTATIYCKECKHSKAYYHGIYSNYPTISYFCYEHCKDVNPHHSCEDADLGRKDEEIESANTYSVGEVKLPKGVFKQIYEHERKDEVEE